MKIVVLDGYTVNPGDLEWTDLERLANCTVYDRTKADELIDRAKDAEIIVCNKVIIGAEQLKQLPKLEYITQLATGYDNIDIDACRRQNIMVSNAANYSTNAVAQHTFALMLELYSKVAAHSEAVNKGWWYKTGDFSFTLGTWHQLSGKTLGLFGFGNIAQKVAAIAHAFGLKVKVHRNNMDAEKPDYVEYVGLDELCQQADILSLHAPATAVTNGIVDESFLSKMKPTSVLINTARGMLINENDLANALNNNLIAAAALDVLQQEPPAKDNPLLSAKNCLITPHMAWSSFEARRTLMDITVQNVRSFMMGEPENIVS